MHTLSIVSKIYTSLLRDGLKIIRCWNVAMKNTHAPERHLVYSYVQTVGRYYYPSIVRVPMFVCNDCSLQSGAKDGTQPVICALWGRDIPDLDLTKQSMTYTHIHKVGYMFFLGR